MMRGASCIAVAVLAAFMADPANAADVKIGVIYPLTGNAASAGQSARDAVHLGADIVNNANPDLKNLPLGATAGLPHLGGAKIVLDEADHQGNPQIGQQQTLRLITQDHVAAMLGSYHSSVSLVATAVAERQGIPYLVADSVATNITGRGFKWTFRTTPIAPDFAKAYADFLTQLKQSGRKVDSIVIVNENTDYGTSVAASLVQAAKTANIPVAAQIPYNANSSDVTAQVLQLKTLNPDAVIFVSYTADIILYFKTMKNLNYLPPIIIGDDSGFSDPSFIPNVGDLARSTAAPSTSASWDRTATSSTRCSSGNTAAISTTPAPAGWRASSCSLTPSTAPARPNRTRSRRRCVRPISSPTS